MRAPAARSPAAGAPAARSPAARSPAARSPAARSPAVGSPAVVVGLDCVTGLQTARILAARGVPVVGVAADPRHFACRTRVCERIVEADTLVEADTTGAALIDRLAEIGPRLGRRAVLYPCTDQSVLALARGRERLEPWYHVVLPDADTVELLMDKVAFAEHAAALGLPIPATLVVRDGAGAAEVAGLGFPVVVKPGLKSPAWEEAVGGKVAVVADAAAWRSLYERCGSWAGPLVVQERVPGGDDQLYSCNAYFDPAGRPVVTFVARKLRQWPRGQGTSSLGEEVRSDEVLETTLKVFGSVDYRGLAYLETKRHAGTGEHLVIEPNVGRPTGRSAIAEAGGVELLYTMYCDAVGLPRPAGLTQRYRGVKWIYFTRDLQSSFAAWRAGELTLSAWWRSLRGVRSDAVWSWRDPLPFLAELAHDARVVVRRVSARGRGAR